MAEQPQGTSKVRLNPETSDQYSIGEETILSVEVIGRRGRQVMGLMSFHSCRKTEEGS